MEVGSAGNLQSRGNSREFVWRDEFLQLGWNAKMKPEQLCSSKTILSIFFFHHKYFLRGNLIMLFVSQNQLWIFDSGLDTNNRNDQVLSLSSKWTFSRKYSFERFFVAILFSLPCFQNSVKKATLCTRSVYKVWDWFGPDPGKVRESSFNEDWKIQEAELKGRVPICDQLHFAPPFLFVCVLPCGLTPSRKVS